MSDYVPGWSLPANSVISSREQRGKADGIRRPHTARRLTHRSDFWCGQKASQPLLREELLRQPAFNWDDLGRAAHYFQIRQRYLEQEIKTKKPFFHAVRILRFDFARIWAATTLTALGSFIGFGLIEIRDPEALGLFVWALLSLLLTDLISMAFYDLARSTDIENPRAELASITEFDEQFPSATDLSVLAMEANSSGELVEKLAQTPAGAPPPGLTELSLSSNSDSLQEIRQQLRTTRRIDIGMTIISFFAFVAGIGICLWLFATTNKIIPGALGVSGSGLVGGFCYYSTGRARSSQIALALFESLVAELSLRLNNANAVGGGLASSERHQAWREFRVNLYELYDRVEEKRRSRPSRKRMP